MFIVQIVSIVNCASIKFNQISKNFQWLQLV